jgi:hypothetical protein
MCYGQGAAMACHIRRAHGVVHSRASLAIAPQCPFCEKAFTSIRGAQQHLRLAQRCVMLREGESREHMYDQVEDLGQEIACPKCAKVSSTLRMYNKHVRDEHADDWAQEQRERDMDESARQCEQCHRRVVKTVARAHSELHRSAKPLLRKFVVSAICPWCRHQFASARSCGEHVARKRDHTSECGCKAPEHSGPQEPPCAPYMCPWCCYSCTDLDTYHRHVRESGCIDEYWQQCARHGDVGQHALDSGPQDRTETAGDPHVADEVLTKGRYQQRLAPRCGPLGSQHGRESSRSPRGGGAHMDVALVSANSEGST